MKKSKKLPKKKGVEKKEKKKATKKAKSIKKKTGISIPKVKPVDPAPSPAFEMEMQLPARPLQKGDPSKRIDSKKRAKPLPPAQSAKTLRNLVDSLERVCEHLEILDSVAPLATRTEIAVSCVRVIEQLGHSVTIERPDI